VPQIDTVFIDAPDVAAQGCGEPAIVPLGAPLRTRSSMPSVRGCSSCR